MKEQFKKLELAYPNLSSAMVFVKLVRYKDMSEDKLRKLFDELVDKKDYQGTPKDQIIEWLMEEILSPKTP